MTALAERAQVREVRAALLMTEVSAGQDDLDRSLIGEKLCSSKKTRSAPEGGMLPVAHDPEAVGGAAPFSFVLAPAFSPALAEILRPGKGLGA